jgi:glycosyltransferase involved in cell wall biosynthesis
MSKIKVIIPAYNEEKAIAHVIKENKFIEIIIISNNSTDNTIKVATAGATVLRKQEGYGYACLKGMEYISNQNKTRYCRVLDGDYSDYPDELTQLIAPILENNIDFVVGSRVARLREKTR